jgi:hypothetical protein
MQVAYFKFAVNGSTSVTVTNILIDSITLSTSGNYLTNDGGVTKVSTLQIYNGTSFNPAIGSISMLSVA